MAFRNWYWVTMYSLGLGLNILWVYIMNLRVVKIAAEEIQIN